MIGLGPELTSPVSLAPPSRDHVIRRLQFASIIIAWTILVITFSSTLGTSSMFIGLWTAIATLTFDGYIIRRRRREEREERTRAPGEPSDSGVEPSQQPSGSEASKPNGDAGPAPYNAQAQVPPSTAATIPSPATAPTTHVEPKLPTEYRWPFIVGRAVLTVLWLLSFVAALVVTILVGGRWNYEMSLPARIIEIIISFGMIGVQGALLVLCIKERERILSLNGIVLYL